MGESRGLEDGKMEKQDNRGKKWWKGEGKGGGRGSSRGDGETETKDKR